eukprot:56631_1
MEKIQWYHIGKINLNYAINVKYKWIKSTNSHPKYDYKINNNYNNNYSLHSSHSSTSRLTQSNACTLHYNGQRDNYNVKPMSHISSENGKRPYNQYTTHVILVVEHDNNLNYR